MLQSANEQLSYLLGLESGLIEDRSKLVTINLGWIAARDVDDMDDRIGALLHAAAAEAAKMAESAI